MPIQVSAPAQAYFAFENALNAALKGFGKTATLTPNSVHGGEVVNLAVTVPDLPGIHLDRAIQVAAKLIANNEQLNERIRTMDIHVELIMQGYGNVLLNF